MSTVMSGPVTGLINRAPGIDIKPDYAGAASAAAKTKQLEQLGQKALRDIRNVSYEADGKKTLQSAAGRPQLASPAAPVKDKLDAAAEFVGVMASIVALLGEAGIKGLESRLVSLRAMAQSIIQSNKVLGAEYEAALAELEAAVGAASTTEEQLEAAKARVQTAQGELDRAEAALAGMDPGSPEYANALATRDAARANLQSAQGGLTAATSAHEQALGKATAANVKFNDISQRANKESALNTEALRDTQKAGLNAASQMTLLMARFAELMGESADRRLEADKELANAVRDAQQALAQKKAEEHDEQVRKAEAANKAMGCIGKLLGGLLTVISVVGAVFTGGASLALAAVGIALMAADMIGKAITGTSFMEQALKPLMDHVLAPMVKILGSVASDALRFIGVPADQAAMIGNIAGAVAGALLMVAAIALVSVAAKGAASRITPKMAEMIGSSASKMVPELLKQGARSASRAMTQFTSRLRSGLGLQSDPVALQRYATIVEGTLAVTEGVGVSAQSALQAKSGVHQARAAEKMAALVIAMSIVETMGKYIEEAVALLGDVLSKQSRLIEQLGKEMQNSTNSSLQLARNI